MESFVARPSWRVRIDMLFRERGKGVQGLAGVGPYARSFTAVQTLAREHTSITIVNLSLLIRKLNKALKYFA